MEISFLLLTSFGGVGVLLFLIFIFVKTRASQEDDFDAALDTPHEATTLTVREIRLLQSTWTTVNKEPKATGLLVFRNYFTDYPDAMRYFKDFKNKPLEQVMKMGQMRAHGVTVVGAVTSVVQNLDDADVLVDILKKTGYIHYSRGIKYQNFLDVNQAILKSLKMGLGPLYTQRAEKAWTKALQVVADVIAIGLREAEQEEEEEEEEEAEQEEADDNKE